MAGRRISRRALAAHYARRVIEGDDLVARQLAAYLIETRRVKELPLIVRDIEDALLAQGVVIADVIGARPIDTRTEKSIADYLIGIYGGEVALRMSVQPEVIGGVRIRTPDAELDTTIKRKLINLQATKI